MKRMKRISILLACCMIATTLFAGTSVFAGGDLPTPENVKAEMSGTSQIKISFSISSHYGVDKFEIKSARLDESAEIITVTKTKVDYKNDQSFILNISELCEESGTYRFNVTAVGASGTSAEGESNELAITVPSSSGESSGSGSSSDSGSGSGIGSGASSSGGSGASGSQAKTGITDVVAPKIDSFSASTLYNSVGYADFSAGITHGSYVENGNKKFVTDTKVELLRNGKRVDQTTTSNTIVQFNNKPVSYAKSDKFTLKVSMAVGGKTYSNTKTVTVKSKRMKKNSVRATKINAKQAVVRWNNIDGATGYRIYKGGKKIKQVKGSVTKYVVKGKGAGKAKYRVVPIRKSEGKVYTAKTNTAKPKANVFTTSNTGKSRPWALKAKFITKKISLTGKTYKVTGWAVNYSDYTKLKKFKKLKYTIYCDGKKVASKTFKNLAKNLKPNSKKKMTLKIKGKAGADVRNGNTTWNVVVVCDPATLNP